MQQADAPRQAALAAKKKLVQAAANEAKLRESGKQASKLGQPVRSKKPSA
jgi:hypothetical protein